MFEHIILSHFVQHRSVLLSVTFPQRQLKTEFIDSFAANLYGAFFSSFSSFFEGKRQINSPVYSCPAIRGLKNRVSLVHVIKYLHTTHNCCSNFEWGRQRKVSPAARCALCPLLSTFTSLVFEQLAGHEPAIKVLRVVYSITASIVKALILLTASLLANDSEGQFDQHSYLARRDRLLQAHFVGL